MKNRIYTLILLAAGMLFAHFDGLAAVYHVKTTGDDLNNGNSWATAFQTLQKALDVAMSGDQIWVAEGTYLPTKELTMGNPRSKTFVMKNGVAIYGGFPSSGSPTFGQRNWVTNVTTLSGDLDNNGTPSNNSFHVIYNYENGLDDTAVLDGFVVTGGAANSIPSHVSGSGMYNKSSSPMVVNCTFSDNVGYGYGAGMSNVESSPTVTNCTFSQNISIAALSPTQGGGMSNVNSSPTVTNCTFSLNQAYYGGGMSNDTWSSPTVSNCAFLENVAVDGGGIYNDFHCSPSVSSCTFMGNVATSGGGLYNNHELSLPNVTSSTFSGNIATASGGGMLNKASSTVANCTFTGNSAAQGGGIINLNCSPTIANCFFTGNEAAGRGGGMDNNLSFPSIVNCTFNGNSAATSGGGISNLSAGPTIANSIFWENGTEISNVNSSGTTVTHSIVQGGYPGTGNLNADPLFISSTNLRLQTCSPAIDAGDNAAIPIGITTDLDGNARQYNGGTVDMGAYESSLSRCDCYASNTRLYVKMGSTGDGKTWGTAFASLQDALDVAEACSGITEIWVAAGIYLPTKKSGGSDERNRTFVMLPGVKIYGGFAGGETSLGQRDWTANVTILSGDLNGDDVVTGSGNTLSISNNGENSYHVILNDNNGLNETSVLDGFTVSGGNADLTTNQNYEGGGMRNKNTSPAVANCIFLHNSAKYFGGAVLNNNNSSGKFEHCIFYGNFSAIAGGGVFNGSSSAKFENCIFEGNSTKYGGGMSNEQTSFSIITNCRFINNAAAFEGGGIQDLSSSSTVTSCIFTNNSTNGSGGGMSIKGNSSPILNNCTFSGNSANFSGGGIYNYDASPTVTNCIIWDNGSEIFDDGTTTTVNYSIIQGSYPGTGNLNADPLFVDAANGDLRLMKCSPAIDAGSNAAIPMGITTDLEGNARILNATGIPTATVDMGAYENTGSRSIMAVCASPTVQLDADGNGSLTEAEVGSGSSADCSPIDLAIDMTTFTCADVGSNSVELTITVPGLMGEGKCTATVTVEDNVLPQAKCKPHTVQLDASGNGSLTANDINNGSSDVCGISSLSASPNTFNCVNIYTTNIVTLTVTDNNGNENTCTAVVTVEDNEYPQPTCKTTTVQLDATGNYALQQNDVFAGGSDNCTIINYWKITPATVSCTDAGTTVPVLVEVFDASGNQASCTANIFVEDDEMPVATCPANIPDVVLNQNGLGTLPANIGDGSSTDNCSAIETSPAMNFQCDAGPHSVTLTVTDGFNTVTTDCSFNVVDHQAPVAHCPANLPDVQLDADGNGSLPANIGDGSSTDNCTVLETSPAMSFTCAGVGAQTVALTASDGFNNSTINCSFNVVDHVSPAANCAPQTIQVSLNANAQYAVDPDQINDNSTDACGIQSLSASPAILDCQHEGTNSVTLNVTDVNGNTASCTATIEVAEFLALGAPISTGESCAGAGDGTVSLAATAGGGQVKYSIDGGANFQASGTFGNLSPGTYNILVKVFGVPAVCEKTAVATVAAGGSPTTWHKDLDGDGYTDGVTQTSCAQPTGYINNPLPGMDCNDNSALEFPGQVWYEDLDGDGYGSGTWSSACLRPTGCFVATELAAVDTDCDDLNAAVSPVATEICDGLDNDCDGETDEGLSETYAGNVLFTTQAQLDAWAACYSVIDGNVTIQGGSITDLSPLSNITEITGNLMIMTNAVLASLDGLENLAVVGGALYMYYNFQLADCCAIYDLLNGGVSGNIVIYFNKVGCNSVADINSNCAPNNSLIAPPSNSQNLAFDGIEPDRMKIYPNPTPGNVMVETKDMEGRSAMLYITNSMGTVVLKTEVQALKQTPLSIGVFHLKDGLYTLTIKADGMKQVSKRFVKMNSVNAKN